MNLFVDKPEYISRFRYAIHPERDEMTAGVQAYFKAEWAWPSDNTRARYLKSYIEHCSWSLYPTGVAARVAVICATWTAFWLLDDAIETLNKDESKALAHRAVDIYLGRTNPSKENRIEAIVAEMRSRLFAPEHNAVVEMVPAIFEDTEIFLKAAGDREERLKSLCGSLDSYLDYRMKDAGAALVAISGLWTEGIIVPSYIQSNAKYHTLCDSYNRHFALVNDLYSYRFEVGPSMGEKDPGVGVGETGGYLVVNVLEMLRHQYSTHQEVVEEVGRRLRLFEDEFFVAAEELKAEYSHSTSDLDIVERVLVVFEYILGGHAYWSSTTPRYNKS